MKFGISKYYTSLNEVMADQSRARLLQENQSSIKRLKEVLFNYDVDEIFLVNEFLDSDILDVKKISIFFETTRSDVANLLDNYILSEFDFDFYISDGDYIYFLSENQIFTKDNYIRQKLSLGKPWIL